MRLSPSSLNLFLECPKCFWLRMKMGVHRPMGPFPSLPGGMDGLIKTYFDKYRAVGKLPPEMEGEVEGAELFSDVEALNRWRNWRTGLTWNDPESGATLSGALDDLMVKGDLYIPADYKTRGYDVKPGGEHYYFNQMNCYALMLKENNMPDIGHAFLIYWISKEVSEGGMTRFDVVVKKVATDSEKARRVVRAAAELIQGPMPRAHSECGFCSWGVDFLTD
jgi:CRISPR/Cas system-associated exonuclease Cas4 (RecB family)